MEMDLETEIAHRQAEELPMGAGRYTGADLKVFKAAFKECRDAGGEQRRCMMMAHKAVQAGDEDGELELPEDENMGEEEFEY